MVIDVRTGSLLREGITHPIDDENIKDDKYNTNSVQNSNRSYISPYIEDMGNTPQESNRVITLTREQFEEMQAWAKRGWAQGALPQPIVTAPVVQHVHQQVIKLSNASLH